jgi:pimeloyl-ACP methyl ester carboxylesterase
MQRVNLDGVDLEYDVQGSGEPLLLIHGSIVADAFFPLLAEPRITSAHRVISEHRRGFAGSARARGPCTMGQQAADCRALLRHLGTPRVHVASHSYGAAIAMQWALDAPEEVQSLALLEPPLMEWIPSGPAYWEWVASVREMYEHGEKTGVTDAFLTGVAGPDYRQVLDEVLPPGAFEVAVADIDTFFQVELPELQQWRFTAEDAKCLRPPVLAVVGSETAPIFSEGHALLKQWMPHAEELVVPHATHALQLMNPRAVADGLVRFFARHTL